jgi:hypothetical protein
VPGEEGHLAFLKSQVDLAQCLMTAGVTFADVVKVNHW